MTCDYKAVATDIVSKTVGYIRDEVGWKLAKKTDPSDAEKNVLIWYKPSTEFNGNVYKSEGVIETSPEAVFKYCEPKPDGLRVKWDKALKGLQIVEHIQPASPEIFVLRTMTHSAAMGMISGRDFVDLVVEVDTDEFIGTIAHSIDCGDKSPETAEFVRGRNHYCGILCYRIPGEPQRTRVYHVAQSDIGGMLPRALIESSLPSAILDFYVNLRAVVQAKTGSELNGH